MAKRNEKLVKLLDAIGELPLSNGAGSFSKNNIDLFIEAAQLGWDIRRNLTKINYRIHTDAIKANLVPPQLTPQQINLIYASEADLLNVALFGKTAKQWRDENPGHKGNIRDEANAAQLVGLANLETLNAHFIQQGLAQPERCRRRNPRWRRQRPDRLERRQRQNPQGTRRNLTGQWSSVSTGCLSHDRQDPAGATTNFLESLAAEWHAIQGYFVRTNIKANRRGNGGWNNLELGLPAEMVYRHPFPGSGLGVRILGEVRQEFADLLRRAGAIFIEELRTEGLYEKVSQAFGRRWEPRGRDARAGRGVEPDACADDCIYGLLQSWTASEAI